MKRRCCLQSLPSGKDEQWKVQSSVFLSSFLHSEAHTKKINKVKVVTTLPVLTVVLFWDIKLWWCCYQSLVIQRYLQHLCPHTAWLLHVHPHCEPSELYRCSVAWYPDELGCQLESAASMGSGLRGTATRQMDPSVVLELHPPLSTQRSPPRTSPPLVCVCVCVCVCACVCACVRACGGHVLAGSHLSKMRTGKRGTSNYVGRHNRWYIIYLWGYIVNALHVITIKMWGKKRFYKPF